MQRVERLTVADHFQLPRIGVVVMPDFAPPAGGWQVGLDTVVVVTPDGRSDAGDNASRALAFQRSGPSGLGGEALQARGVLPHSPKDEVPIGSKVMVSQPLKAAIQRRQQPKPSN